MELSDLIRTLRQRWLAVLLCALIGLAVAAGITAATTKVYTAEAQSFVAIASSDKSSGDILAGATFTLQRVKSYTSIVTSPEVLQPVIDELGLNVTVEQLAPKVTATSPLDTVLIAVAVKDPDPQQAALTANAVALQLGKVVERLETPLGATSSPVKVSLITKATPPTSPSSPRTLVNLALGLLLGLAVGVALAAWRQRNDTRIGSADEVQAISGSVPLGLVPFDTEAAVTPLITADSRQPRAEAYRAVRTNLRFVDIDNPPRVVAITSAVPSEGKTTSACNLALSLAESGLRVALVEGDLRRGRMAEYLQIEGTFGLTNVLLGEASIEQALVPWRRGQLSVLPAGRLAPNPSELLSSNHMRALLDDLRSRFDTVIIDAAPLLPVTDGAVVANVADGALVIVRHGHTTREQLAHAFETLQLADARVLGTVLNFVPMEKKRGGYGYGYGYGGYGSYVGRDPAAAGGDRAAAGSDPLPGVVAAPAADAVAGRQAVAPPAPSLE